MLIQLGTSQCSLGTSSISEVNHVSPRWNKSGFHTILTLRLGRSLSLLHELLGEFDVVEENIRIVEFVIPGAL